MHKTFARWARQCAAATLALFALALSSHLAAQDSDPTESHGADFEFVLDILRSDYAGFEHKVADREDEFAAQVDLARQRIANQPDARIHAIDALLDWFDDKHLTIRSNIVSPADPWPGGGSGSAGPMGGKWPGWKFAFERLSPQTVMLRVPDFSPDSAETLTALLAEHRETILSTPNLLIDLRYNSGGADYVYEELMALIYTRPIYSIGVELRASSRNIAAIEEILNSGGLPEDTQATVEEILARAKAETGEWVRMSERGFAIRTYPQVYPMPERVGILIEGAGSSGEQFALDSRASRKVTLLGAPTAGVLDYSNVISAAAPSGDFDLAWPMTRSMRLPEEPVDPDGISPDVPFPADEDDPVAAAQAWLERRGE